VSDDPFHVEKISGDSDLWSNTRRGCHIRERERIANDVRYWHLADISDVPADVRFRGQSGHRQCGIGVLISSPPNRRWNALGAFSLLTLITLASEELKWLIIEAARFLGVGVNAR
jgi:hypothetical protein